MPINVEVGAIIVFVAIQLITYGALRQQVKNLEDSAREEKLERKQLEERVRELEIQAPGTLSFSKKTGG